MSSQEKMQEGLPVGGYRPQSEQAIAAVNVMKMQEESILRILDGLAADAGLKVDPRWLAIGRSQIEQGFMAINRSIFKPDRLDDEKVAALNRMYADAE